MRRSNYIINIKAVVGGLFFVGFLCGCNNDHSTETSEGVEVIINGALPTPKSSRAQIVPQNGLPTEKLDVAIITVNFETDDPENIQPDLAAWRGSTADITRGYFGGPGINATTITNGEIKYTNEDGDMVQKVFYEENGEYYFVRVVYPYQKDSFIQTGNGAAMVISGIDGSVDVLCSNLGWGNIDQPEVETNATNKRILFSHMFSLFRIKLKPENESVASKLGENGEMILGQYGEIQKVRLANQPESVVIDMIDLAMDAYSYYDTPYYAVGFEPFYLTMSEDATPAPVTVNAGYIMAMPGRDFTFEVYSKERLWLSADLSFATETDPYKTSEPGKIYDIILELGEGYEMIVEAAEAKEWWQDSVFD